MEQQILARLATIQEIATAATTREEMWQHIITQCDIAQVAEVGVYRGAFAESLLSGCKGIESYVMIDPWQQLPDWHKPANQSDAKFDDIYNEAMARTAFAETKRRVLRCQTKEAAPQMASQCLDLAYIDGDHTLRGITLDLMLMFDKVKPGGIIGGDDFTKSIWQHGPDYDPTFVCPYAVYFAEAMNMPIVALPFHQFLILKDSTLGFEFIHFTEGYKNLRLNKLARLPARMRR